MVISIVEKTKDYVVIKIPRKIWADVSRQRATFPEEKALMILKAGMKEFRKGATKPLASLRSLRHGS